MCAGCMMMLCVCVVVVACVAVCGGFDGVFEFV